MIHDKVSRLTYLELVNKVKQRLSKIGNKKLSLTGRVALVQYVTSSMTSYLMQTSFIPKNVTQEIDRLNRNFVWKHLEGEKKIHSIS